MSGWRCATRALYSIGGVGKAPQIEDQRKNCSGSTYTAMAGAKKLGLVTTVRNGCLTYSLTSKGEHWCEGGIVADRGIGGAKSAKALGFAATWLMPLVAHHHPLTLSQCDQHQMELF